MSRPILSLAEAVQQKVHDGTTIYVGNFGSQLFVVAHEIIRQGRIGLDIVVASGGLLLDQLLGADAVGSATLAHCWSPVGPSPAWNFRRLAEAQDNPVELHEMSLGMMTAALTAGAWGVPFMPFPGLQETGFVQEGWTSGRIAGASSEFGEHLVVQAITPDVAFVHVDRCDSDGNAWIGGPLGEVVIAAAASQEVVIVAEELVDAGALREHGINIPGVMVSAIVISPGAVYPDGAVGRYDRDVAAYAAYTTAAATTEGFQQWRKELGSSSTEGDAR
jgi:glutaconate CoA-transferase subunit A